MKQSTDSINAIYEYGCMALRNRSWLIYEVGERVSDSTLHLRIVQNSEEGTFSREWICSKDIVEVLKIKPQLAGVDLKEFMKFGDSNTGGFVLAICVDLGLVRKKDARTYEYVVNFDLRSAVEKRLGN